MDVVTYIVPLLNAMLNGPKAQAMTVDDLHFLAFHAISRAGHDVQARAVKGMSLTPTKTKYNTMDFGQCLEENAIASIKTDRDLSTWLMELFLYSYVGNSRKPHDYHSNGPVKEGNPIHVLAKRRKISFAEAWKPIHASFEDRRIRAAKRAGLDEAAAKPSAKKAAKKPVKAKAKKNAAKKR